MKVKMILPSLMESGSPWYRPIKYSLFPPLGLASLAAHLPEDWEVEQKSRAWLEGVLDAARPKKIHGESNFREAETWEHFSGRGA
jgi:hypothetical protein